MIFMPDEEDVPLADVTLGEIVRSLKGLQDEVRALRGEHVRRDLYEAHRRETELAIQRIESECSKNTTLLAQRLEAAERERRDRGWQLNLALIGAVVSIIVAFIGFFH